jgi:hypothetical protein
MLPDMTKGYFEIMFHHDSMNFIYSYLKDMLGFCWLALMA